MNLKIKDLTQYINLYTMTIKKNLFAILSFFTLTISAQGLLLSTQEELSEIEQYIEEDRGYTSYLPSKYSLEKYAPPIQHQTGSSCVGWATCYSAASIMYNIDRNITSSFEKKAFAFDPYYMYSIMYNTSKDEECKKGLNFIDAMRFFEDWGTKHWSMPPFLSCNSKWSNSWLDDIQYQSQPFAIDNYYKLDVNDIDLIKKQIYDKTPVIIGAYIGESFGPMSSERGRIGNSGLWNPDYKNDSDISGHAMTIVAYDNYKFGGAFKIMNSWGSSFGEEGFVWIKYEDFARVVGEAWKISKSSFKNVENNYYTQTEYIGGDKYEGNFNKAGEKHMFGIYQWKLSGNIYFGYWLNDNQDGVGLFFNYSRKEVFFCDYEDGVLIDSEFLGFSDGDDVKSDIELYLESFDIGLKFNNANPSVIIEDTK